MMKNGYVRSLQSALLVVVMAAAWYLLAPVEFGGSATYVLVAGASMEPALQQGDLVITRQNSSYQIGDVTAYLHPQVGPVIHRVIDRNGPYYTLQGDNNDWIDSYQPTSEEIMGRSWLHIPRAAEVLVWLRTPLGLSLLSLSVGSMFLLTFVRDEKRRESRRKQSAEMFSKWHQQAQSLRLAEWVFPLSILFFAAVLLGLFAFSRPQFETIPADLPYNHAGSFSYSGVGSPAIYDRGQIASGEAVFHALVNELDMEFSYNFAAEAPADVGGTYAVDLRISEPNGWQRTLELQPETAFEEGSFQLAATLDVDQITGIVGQLRERTELNRQTFNVDINVAIGVSGTLAGLPFADTFTATLPFIMDEIELYVASSDPAGENGDPLSVFSTAYLTHAETIPTSLSIFGLTLSVRHARTIALLAGGLSLALLAFIIAPALSVSRSRPSERIKLKYADHLVDVSEIPYKAKQPWVEVSAFEDLVKLTDTIGGLILHLEEDQKHTYVLEHGGTCYRFILHNPAEIATDSDPKDE